MPSLQPETPRQLAEAKRRAAVLKDALRRSGRQQLHTSQLSKLKQTVLSRYRYLLCTLCLSFDS